MKHQSVVQGLAFCVNKVAANVESELKQNLLSGLAGQVLFLFCINKMQPDEKVEAVLQQQIDRLQSGLQRVLPDYSFATGLSGIGWLLEFIIQELGEKQDVNAEIDEFLLDVIDRPQWSDDFELLNGLCGIGQYGLIRAQYDSGRKLLDRTIDLLLSLMQEDADGVYWNTPAASQYHSGCTSEGEQNLGLAHGVVGVIAILTRYFAAAQANHLRPILTKSCYWLLAQKRRSDDSYFSYYSSSDDCSRIGWCYGDLSNALTLARAGMLLKDDLIVSRARDIALQVARRPHTKSMVVDISLCHGSAGNYLLFDELKTILGDDEFGDAASYWLQDTLTLFQSKDGLPYFDPIQQAYVNDASLLTGYAGIGLALMRAQGASSDWSSCLCIS